MVTTRAVKLFLALAVLTLVSIPAGMAQESGDLDFSYGTISKITGNDIVLRSYDYEKGEEVEIAYEIDSQIVLEDVGSVEDLHVGDDVDVEYVEVDGKKTIKSLYKASITEIEEEAEEMEEDVEEMEEDVEETDEDMDE